VYRWRETIIRVVTRLYHIGSDCLRDINHGRACYFWITVPRRIRWRRCSLDSAQNSCDDGEREKNKHLLRTQWDLCNVLFRVGGVEEITAVLLAHQLGTLARLLSREATAHFS
jgi:hypothetical protein